MLFSRLMYARCCIDAHFSCQSMCLIFSFANVYFSSPRIYFLKKKSNCQNTTSSLCPSFFALRRCPCGLFNHFDTILSAAIIRREHWSNVIVRDNAICLSFMNGFRRQTNRIVSIGERTESSVGNSKRQWTRTGCLAMQ